MKSEKGCWIGSGRWIVMICLGEEPHQFLAYGIQDTNFDQQDVFFFAITNRSAEQIVMQMVEVI